MPLVAFGLAIGAFFIFGLAQFAEADSVGVDFENPPCSLEVIHNQDGWTSSGAAGSGCGVYDHAVSSSFSTPTFGSQSLRISNAVTSGCFGDMTFAKPLVNAVGETGAGAGSFPIGTLQKQFVMEFDVTSAVPVAEQPGLFMSISPDRGDGSRMSYLGFADSPTGIRINFFDVQGTGNPANFVETVLGTFARDQIHRIKLVFEPRDGASNDIVGVCVNGVLEHVGTSWENYYRFDSEASAEQNVRATRTVIFRTGGTAVPAHAGKGYLIDNLSLLSATPPAPAENTVVVHHHDLAMSFADVISDPSKWFFYNDETDVIDTTLGSFVTGPSAPPLGVGSAHISVTGTERRNLATFQFGGIKLEDITELA